MADEIYLQKSTQYHSGEYMGAAPDGDLYKGIVAFMVVRLKRSLHVVVNAFPETSISGEWIAQKLNYGIVCFAKKGF